MNASRAEWHEEALKEGLSGRLAEVGPEQIRLGLHCPPPPPPPTQGRIQDFFQEGVHSSLALLQHQ